MYADKCMDNQLCTLFALTGGAVTQGMLVIPKEKQNKKYQVPIE